MEQLATHLKAAGTKRNEFARIVGISAPYLTQILSGLKRPSLDLAFRIETATGGVVPASCWVSHQEPSLAASHIASEPSE
jgi:transcriptional regulator with XRE-family HTH domain